MKRLLSIAGFLTLVLLLAGALPAATGTVASAGYQITPASSRVLTAPASTGWEDGFESYAPGSWPAPWSCAICNGFVDDTQYSEGVQSLKIIGDYGGCWEADAEHSLQVAAPFEVELSAETGAFSGCHNRGLMVRPSTADCYYCSLAALQFDPDGMIRTQSGLVLGSYSMMTWYRLRIRYEKPDADHLKMTYWLDGEFKGSETIADSYELVNFSLFSGDGPSWVDDVQVASRLPALHLFRMKLAWSRGSKPGTYKEQATVVVKDQANLPAGGVTVLATWTLPDGSQLARTAVTNTKGQAKFGLASRLAGTYTFCVDDLHKAGYAYDPTANSIPNCQNLVVGP